MLSNNRYIKPLLACIVFFVFAIAITPKKILHDIFAKHEDTRSKASDHGTTSISTSGYNCNCDDQVAESSFLHSFPFLEITLPATCSSTGILEVSFTSLPNYYTSLRGPPVML
jgi:hypothetical protein